MFKFLMNSYGLKAAIEVVLMNEIICLIITMNQ